MPTQGTNSRRNTGRGGDGDRLQAPTRTETTPMSRISTNPRGKDALAARSQFQRPVSISMPITASTLSVVAEMIGAYTVI